jgi:hypothetical protein
MGVVMDSSSTKILWRTSVAIRITHPDLEPESMTEVLHTSASISKRPGESKIPHGDCKSAGYWCVQHWIDEPTLPDHAFSWAEQFVVDHRDGILSLLSKGCRIDVYIGVKSKLLALGFNVPATPTLWELGITVGIEYFSS